MLLALLDDVFATCAAFATLAFSSRQEPFFLVREDFVVYVQFHVGTVTARRPYTQLSLILTMRRLLLYAYENLKVLLLCPYLNSAMPLIYVMAT